jgi:cell division protein FtsB
MFQASRSMKGLSRFAYAIVVLVVTSYAFVTLRGPKGLDAIAQQRHEIRALEKRNELLNQEIERKPEHIHRLVQSPAEQELEIRDRLKLVKPNEKIFIIDNPGKK